MILLISSLEKARALVSALENTTKEPVKLCSSLRAAVDRLEVGEFSAVVFDQLLLDTEPDSGEAVFRLLGSAVPVFVNFALAGANRVVSELRSARQRRKREFDIVQREAARAFRSQLNDDLTSILLSCEMALRVPHLPDEAGTKLRDAADLARQLGAKLTRDVTSDLEVISGD